jgi:transmembrane sensor
MMKEFSALNRLQDDGPDTDAMPAPASRSPDDPLEQAALAWLARLHSGHWTADDAAAHAAWLAADPNHPAAWQRAEALWHELAGLRPFAAAELRALHARPVASVRRSGWGAGLAFAGIAALALGIALLLPGSFSQAQSQQTARGEQRTIALADGSRIELNTASRVEIDYGFGCRCVRLPAGEAVFHVAHGDPRPFKVAIRRGTIRDIGTDFWVRDDANKIAVAVIEGEIEITPNAGGKPARLKAGDQLAWDRDGRRLDEPSHPLDDLLAWRQGALVFRDAPLTEVIAEFARYHAVNIELDARLAQYRLSGRLPSADLDGLLALIRSAYAVDVRRPTAKRLRILLKSARG